MTPTWWALSRRRPCRLRLPEPSVSAAEIVTSTLSAHPKLAGLFSTNDQGAIGVLTGLRQAGALGKVVVAYDAAAAEVAALKNGAIHVLIAQDPKQEGEVAMESAAKLIKGDKLGKTTLTEIVTIKAGDTATRRQVRIQRRLRLSVWRTPLCSGEAASLIFVEKAARESADL